MSSDPSAGKVSEDKVNKYEANVLAFSKMLLGAMKKSANGYVKKDEFCGMIKDLFFNNGIVLINDLFAAVVQKPPQELGEEKGGGH